jgi:hypothetical protein
MAHKICFRGDDRHPTLGATIFAHGFQKRNIGDSIQTKIDDEAGLNLDIDSPTAVCVSARLSAAVIFPFYNPDLPARNIGPNWLYIMAIDTKDIFNTHKMQVDQMLKMQDNDSDKAILNDRPNDVMVWLCAQELAVDEVPHGNIIAAVSFIRSFYGTNWKDGGTYTLVKDTLEQNGYCTVPDDTKTQGLDFLKEELAMHQNGKLFEFAQVESGFLPSTQH